MSTLLGNLRVGTRLALVPLLYTVAIVSILAYTVHTASQQELDTVMVDVAARQRMLSERHLQEVLVSLAGGQADYQETRRIFEDSQKDLRQGGVVTFQLGQQEVPIPAVPAELTGQVDEQAELFSQVVAGADELLATPSGDPRFRTRLAGLHSLTDDLSEHANELTKALTRHSQGKLNSMIRYEILIAVVATLVGLAFAFEISRQITRPLEQVVEAARRISEGNLRGQPLALADRDEVGELARAFNVMQESLCELVGQAQLAANNLTSATSQVSATSSQQASSTMEQMASVQETTATMEELEQTSAQVSERARQVGATAEATSVASASGVEAVQKTFALMEEIREQVQIAADNVMALSEKNQAVREVIATVTDIAERANLLALNAAIEAASAGEAGSRFSVVAEELKSLAEQARSSTVEVRRILGDIEERIQRSVLLTEETVKRVEAGRRQAQASESSILELNRSALDSVRAFQQIVASSGQQQIGFEQVVEAIGSIRLASEQNTLGIKQLEAASANLNALAQQLQAATRRFQV